MRGVRTKQSSSRSAPLVHRAGIRGRIIGRFNVDDSEALGGNHDCGRGGGLLALAVIAANKLAQDEFQDYSGAGWLFGMIPPLIFFMGGIRFLYADGLITDLQGLGNRMVARAKRSWRKP